MAIHYWAGEFVEMQEIRSLVADGRLDDFQCGRVKTLALSSGALKRAVLEKAVQDFAEIGVGKPLSIRIHTAYVGDLRTWLNRRADVLIVSGIKAAQTFDAVGRTVNVMQPRMKDHEYAEFSAFEKGSPLVYYTRAVTNFDMNASFELVPDSFDERTLNKVANLFQLSAGLPVFAPAASYLMAGSLVTKMIADLGKAFVESSPTLRDTINLNFGVAGLPLFKAGFYLITNDGSLDAPNAYRIQNWTSGNETVVRLIANKTNEPYDGDIPYLIIGVDGHEEPKLENYEPHLATAAILEKFYPSDDGTGVLMNELGEALTLYNDLRFRKDAQDLRTRLGKMKPDDPDYDRLKKLFDAYRKNIRQDEFQVEEIPGKND